MNTYSLFFRQYSTPGCCIYSQVNDIAFHPVHGTLSTVGSDGRFSFWDKDARTKLKTSDQFDQPITTCAFNAQGNIFGYASSYDWSKVFEYFINASNSSCGEVMFSQEFCRGGRGVSQHAMGRGVYTPLGKHPLGRHPPSRDGH